MIRLEDGWRRLSPRPAGRCLLGLSGGADSVALLLLLLPLREAGEVELVAAHVNHGLRGEASEADEDFVRELCAREHVPLRTVRLDLRGRRDENAAREARYAAFRSILAAESMSTLILAHQRDDQAETFLMRLLRGAGPEGLGGMRPEEQRESCRLLRPMLGISGAELRAMLREAGIPWREDATNQETTYFRNRIRLELMPRLEEMAAGAAGRIARTAELIGEENEAMAGAAEKLLLESEEAGGLGLESLRAAPAAVRTRALRMWWRYRGPRLEERELSYAQTRRLDSLTEAPRGTIINLPAGWRARREKDRIRLMDPSDRTKNNRPRGEKGKKHD